MLHTLQQTEVEEGLLDDLSRDVMALWSSRLLRQMPEPVGWLKGRACVRVVHKASHGLVKFTRWLC